MNKLYLIISLACAFVLNSEAQEYDASNLTNCLKYVMHYEQYFKLQQYDKAFSYWKTAYETCAPDTKPMIYDDGARMLRKKIDDSAGDERKELVSMLLNCDILLAKHSSKMREEALKSLREDVGRYISEAESRLYDYEEKINLFEEQLRSDVCKIAMGDPEYSGDALKSIEKAVVYNAIASAIAESDGCYLHVRDALDPVMSEFKLQQGGLVSSESMVPMGEFYAADAICAVNVIYDDNHIYINASLINADTGQILASASDGVGYVFRDDIVALDKTSQKIGRDLVRQLLMDND